MWNTRFEFLENHYYHIYNRWFEKQIIFKNDIDFKMFYKYIIKNLNDYKIVKIISWSILPNHFHFVIQNLETGLILSDFMRKIQVSYAMYFKKKYKIGRWPVFEWRFKSKIINNDKYLYQCIAYVNFNSLKHGLVNNIYNYKWSSYHQINKHIINKYKDMILEELEY